MTDISVTIRQNAVAALAAASILFPGPFAHAEGLQSFESAISDTRVLLDMRLRYEGVDQPPLARDADAVTLRTRAGFETGKVWGTALLAEAEWVLPLATNYNSTINGKTVFPTVADPKALEVNRLQLTNTRLPQTTVVLGRQRINLDDQRFVGNVGWRQNEQTFDAVRVTNKSIGNLTLDSAYLNQVNRVFGNESPQGRFHGDTFLFNASYQFPLGKLTGFAYVLGFDDAAAIRDSSQTYGSRFAGETKFDPIDVAYAVSYATQRDHGNNPINYSASYYMVDVSARYGQFNAGAGYEVLEGNGAKGFATPLATLHKIQGWADKFLVTPPNGIEDLYFTVGYARKNVGPIDMASVSATFHDFRSERLSFRYGNEINWQIYAKWRHFAFTLKYADYGARAFATDTKKLWFQIEYSY